jgi:cobalt-zinc-cadmium efflux system protein
VSRRAESAPPDAEVPRARPAARGAGHGHPHDEGHRRGAGHDHRADHGHGHGAGPGGEHGHAHAPRIPGSDGAATRRALIVALALTAGFAVVEAIGGWIAGSLALLSDAGHMITDAAALGLALFADRIARRPPSTRASYGYGRAEVLAAFVNAIAMLAVVAAIAVEAVRRLLEPAPVAGGLVIAVGLAGLAINVAAAWVLARASRSMNARGALLHVMGDLLGSLAAVVAGGVIMATGWSP